MNNATPDFNSQHFEVAGFIREVFGYMERFKGQLFVLKIEDDLMSHPLFPVRIYRCQAGEPPGEKKNAAALQAVKGWQSP